MQLTKYVCIFCLTLLPAKAIGDRWELLPQTENFWIKSNAHYEADTQKRSFFYDAFRFDRIEYSYELLHMDELLQDSYPEITSDFVVYNEESDTSRIVRPSMKEAWNYLSNDETIVALVPFGFSEVAGEPSLVGFRKQGGVIVSGVYSAPNLDTIFCLDDEDEHNRREDKGLSKYRGQIPVLFPIVFSSRVNYQYLDDFEDIHLGTSYDSDRFQETFESCPDMIQIGYRIISPRDIDVDDDSDGRISHGKSSLDKLQSFDRVVMSYDRFGYLNFVRSRSPSHVHDFGHLLSSSAYYDDQKCKYRENGSYPKRSLSCELWAVSVSAFDGAAVFLRTPGSNQPIVWGDETRTSPAVLVVRERMPKVTLPLYSD